MLTTTELVREEKPADQAYQDRFGPSGLRLNDTLDEPSRSREDDKRGQKVGPEVVSR